MSTVRKSLGFSVIDSYLGLVLQLASTMIIARVLTPKEVGIYAVAAVFSGLASMFRDFGVAEYLIQEKELTQRKIAAALTLNIGVSWLMAVAMFFGAPLAAHFYADPGIGEVMRIQAIGFCVVPFGAVTMAYFRRELNFRPVLVCNTLGNVTAFVVAVSLALGGFGYLSLAWSSVAAIGVTVVASILYRPAGFPRWPGLQGVGEVFHFSKFVSAIYLFGQVGKGAPEMIIGRSEGVVAVAMFSRANGLVGMFNRLVMRPVMLVCMPYFAHSDREQGHIADAYVKSVSYLTAFGWPFLLFMGISALSAIRIVYGSQWDDAAPLARILCAACALELVHVMSREALLAKGEASSANAVQIGVLGLQILGLLAVVPFGLEGAAWGVLLASALGIFVSQWKLRQISVRIGPLAKACLQSLLLALASNVPVAIWAAMGGAARSGDLVFGGAGILVTALVWILLLRWTRHPLGRELEGLARDAWARLRAR